MMDVAGAAILSSPNAWQVVARDAAAVVPGERGRQSDPAGEARGM